MPKEDKSLGRCLIKALKKRSNFVVKDGYRHTSDLQDGRDFARLNLKSVTEQTSLDDFLDKTALAQADYISELSDIRIVEKDVSNGLLTESEKALIALAQDKNKAVLSIPRRPNWDSNTSKELLDAMERESFLAWRQKLALLREKEHIELTPYEKNLEVWRQLWRVIERSDVVVQIVDARNPLLFRCPDLELYVREIDEKKTNILLLNKADFLTEDQRECWCNYFDQAGVQIAFFSALEQKNRPLDEENGSESQKDSELAEVDSTHIKNNSSDDENDSESNEDNELAEVDSTRIKNNSSRDENESELQEESEFTEVDSTHIKNNSSHEEIELESHQESELSENIDSTCIKNSPKVLSREELLSFLKSVPQFRSNENISTIGLVGYPNVGKSSTINAILMSKKVSVSATPGKTKHFQTHIIDKELCLCDCPGLVFPNFVSTKAEMVINGILPIDELTNCFSFIPKHILESTYSIFISTHGEGRDPKSPPTAEEFLNAHGYNRGYMTRRGLPDNARSARYVLKDFVNGKLLYCHAPPDVKQEDYHQFPDVKPKKSVAVDDKNINTEKKIVLTEDDKRFFAKYSGVHMKGKAAVKTSDVEFTNKPWKKHNNRNKKEKLRRIYKNPYE